MAGLQIRFARDKIFADETTVISCHVDIDKNSGNTGFSHAIYVAVQLRTVLRAAYGDHVHEVQDCTGFGIDRQASTPSVRSVKGMTNACMIALNAGRASWSEASRMR